MKYFLDTEFIEDGKTIDLVSIGIVAEDGRELYLEIEEADLSRACDWVKENVIPFLTGKTTTRLEASQQIKGFVGNNPEFWSYFGDYDWVVLCQLYGRMTDLPDDWPMYCNDLKQLLETDPRAKQVAPPENDKPHNSLEDARMLRDYYNLISERTQ